VTPASTLAAHPRARGGGGDGGSTGAENRAAYLEMYAERKADAVDPGVTALARCTRCALSGAPLAEPVVADELGALFNKVRDREREREEVLAIVRTCDVVLR
jgi:Rtf2 RING-finger